MNMTLEGDFSQFSTEDYLKVENKVCTSIGKNCTEINVDELRSGSIIIRNTINAVNSQDQANVMNQLRSLLQSG